MTRTNAKLFRKTVASGLAVSMLLTVLPGCTARHMPDWSRVQAVSPKPRPMSDCTATGRFRAASIRPPMTPSR